jgi:hypothetical protein
VRREGAMAWHPVRISAAHLAAAPGGEVRMPLPDGGELTLRRASEERNDDGTWTWVGRSDQLGGREAILTFGAHAVFGSVPQAGGPDLRITTRNLQTYIVETERVQARALGASLANVPYEPDFRVPDLAVRKAALAAQRVASAPPVANAYASTSTDTQVIDLLVGYTTGFKNQWVDAPTCTSLGAAACEARRKSIALTRLNYMVQTANLGFATSAVAVRLRMVNAMAVAWPDNTANGDTLNKLTGSNGNASVTVPAALVPLRNARETYGADLVALVRKFNLPENESCGLGWLLGANLTGISPSHAPYAYSVVQDGEDLHPTAGFMYPCRDEQLAHEVGHNMGSQHDGMHANGVPGAYPYSYGYRFAGIYSIMAEGDVIYDEPYRVFSNPRITYCSYKVCGTANADNARSLGNTAAKVAAFRATKYGPSRPLLPAFDGNADGRSDLFFRDGGYIPVWFMNGTTRLAEELYGGYFNYDEVLIDAGDMRGDGHGDLLGAFQSLWPYGGRALYVKDFDGGYWNESMIGETPPELEPIALMDINGDGRSEVVLRNPYSGAGQAWFYSPPTWGPPGDRVKTTTFALPAAWAFVGHGHFNADKFEDAVWADANGHIAISASNGDRLVAPVQVPLQYDKTYALAAVHDMNGDGRSDFVFWHAPTRRFAVWYMAGTTRLATSSAIAPSGWWLVGRGDFNGDKRGDLAWTNLQREVAFTISTGTAVTWAKLPYAPYGEDYKMMGAQ